jgi:hypothetical protein
MCEIVVLFPFLDQPMVTFINAANMITFDRDWCMIVRDDVPAVAKAALLRGAGSHLRMPDRFLPDPDLLAVHRAVFERAA